MEPIEMNKNDEESNARPSFRKPLNDASGRNYRRHSPTGGYDSSHSDDSPRRGRRGGPSRENYLKMTDKKRRDVNIDTERDHSKRIQDYDSRRHVDREAHTNSHNHHRYDGHGRDHRDDSERSYYKSSKSARNVEEDSSSQRRGKFDRSLESSRGVDKPYRDQSVARRNEEKHATHLKKDDGRSAEHDRHRGRQSREDRREYHHSPEDHRSGHSVHDEARGCSRYPSSRDVDGHEGANKRRRAKMDADKNWDSHDKEADELKRANNGSLSCRQERHLRNATNEAGQDLKDKASPRKKSDLSEEIIQDSKATSVAEKPYASSSKFSSAPSLSYVDPADVTVSQDAATAAAMRAAEMVNRNLIGGGGLSITEQKKKLLWGNKKSTEESSSHWDFSLIPDRERQEKFRKLMGAKGEVKLETKQDNKDGDLRAKKQEELQMDLEKQYTAGLRRRDGRTVGLGL